MSYELTAYDIAIISGGFATVGTLIGTLLSYRFAIKLAAVNARKEAAQKFISIFHTELSGLYPYPIKWPDNIIDFLESKFIILNAAVSDFRHCLTPDKWEAFDNAWFSFYNATGRKIDNENCQCYLHYMPFTGSSIVNGKQIDHDTTKTYKATFKSNVDSLLKFARLT